MIDYMLEVCYNNNIVAAFLKAFLYTSNFKMPKGGFLWLGKEFLL